MSKSKTRVRKVRMTAAERKIGKALRVFESGTLAYGGVKFDAPGIYPGERDEHPRNQMALIGTAVAAYSEQPKVWVPADKHVWEWQVALLKRQQNCSHRKGDTWFVSTPNTGDLTRRNQPTSHRPQRAVFPLPRFYFDFNVSLHTFVDRHQEIKCLTCKRIWKSGDPDFNEAMKMVQNSSNKPSSSEFLVQLSSEQAKLMDPQVIFFDDLLYNKKGK